MITTEMIKQLREKTGAGIMECRNALGRNNEDMKKAISYLKEKGLSTVMEKSKRVAAEGVVDAYIHGNGRIGVLLEVNVETDFAALNKEFRTFVRDLEMQIAAGNPKYISREEIPFEVIDNIKENLKTHAINTGKPVKVIEKIVEGQLEKYFKDVCLMEQPYIKDPDITVRQLLNDRILTIGENIIIRRFARFEMGEGLEKRTERND